MVNASLSNILSPSPSAELCLVSWEATETKQEASVGKANLEHLKAHAEGLSALNDTPEGQSWLAALAPDQSEQGKQLDLGLRKAVTEDVATFLRYPDAFARVEEDLDKAEVLFRRRI